MLETKLVGYSQKMTFSQDKTLHLWQTFMPLLANIQNRKNKELISLQTFAPTAQFTQYNPNMEFEKWAAVAVSAFESVASPLDTFIIPQGLYAVFLYKGSSSKAFESFFYIFSVWFPQSEYQVDSRPHFEIMGEKYRNNHQESEEEIWIPIKKK